MFAFARRSMARAATDRISLIEFPPPPSPFPLPPPPSSRFFFSPLISFAENSANLRCTNRAEGGVESRFFFFSEGDETFSYYRIIIRMINFKNLQFIDNNKVFIFHSFRDKHLFPKCVTNFLCITNRRRGAHNAQLRRMYRYLSTIDCISFLSNEKKNDEAIYTYIRRNLT